MKTVFLPCRNSFFFFLILSFTICIKSYAQTSIPQLASFSAVVRDANNQPLVNTQVGLRLTFRKGGIAGPKVYCASHQEVSNANGFVSIQLNRNVLSTGCNGAPTTEFENIPWEEGGFWMEVEYQTATGGAFTSLGQLELASSFYAFSAGTAEKVKGLTLQGAQNGNVLTFNQTTGKWEPAPASGGPQGTAVNQMMYWNGNSWALLQPGSNGQTLTLCNGTLTWTDGGICPGTLPVLSTSPVSAITSNAAQSGGNVSQQGASAIIQRGICWSTSPFPTTASNTKTLSGSGLGSFSSSLTGLSPNTLYYVRAFASNSLGTAYGNQITVNTADGNVTDIDGNSYQTTTIGSQIWLAENLRVGRYRNGDPIPTNFSDGVWAGLTTGAYALYDNAPANNTAYGKLYNWYAVADPRGLCPAGWHVPSDNEWKTLETSQGMTAGDLNLTGFRGQTQNVGGKLKAISSLWTSPNAGATNESGFTGLPGGYRDNDGPFLTVGNNAYWWASLPDSGSSAWFRGAFFNVTSVPRDLTLKTNGLSVRCVKD